MTLKITRPYFADVAKGSIFDGFRLTTHGATGTLAAMAWPPPKGGHPAPPGASLLAQRAKVHPARPLYRLDGPTNAVQQAARRVFDPAGVRLTIRSHGRPIEWGAVTGARTFYLDGHPPALPINHARPITP